MNEEEIRYERARKKVEAIKGFYVHLSIYLLVNLFLLLLNILTSPDTLWFWMPLLGWGIAILAHGFSVFGVGRFFGPDWEERKIAEIMEKEESA